MSFFTELKRRNIFRVAAAYLVIGWLVVQVIDVLAPIFDVSSSFQRGTVLLLLVGFIPVMFFTWAYEITGDGIKKESEINRDDALVAQSDKKLNIITLVAVFAAGGMFAYQQLSPTTVPIAVTPDTTSTQAEKESAATEPLATEQENSIAVLPFDPLSNDDSDEYFGKGIAEELLNSLAQFPHLKVAARTSAFSFEGKNVDLRELAKTLGVAHVLEGSVRRSGERLRITAQLIRAADGFHLWSATYDRDQSDIFVIQDEIVAELSRILQFQLGVGAGVDRATRKNVDPRAYNEYLKGLNYWWQRDKAPDNRLLAMSTFENATQFDNTFADAWSAYAASLILSGEESSNMTPAEKRLTVDQAMARALELDPDNVRAHAAAVFHDKLPIDTINAHLQKATDLAPNSPFVNYAAGHHYFRSGDHRKSIAAYQRTKTLDPLNKTMARNRNAALGAMGLHRQALDELKMHVVCKADQCDGNHANNAWVGLQLALQLNQKEHIAVWFGHFNNALSGWGDNQPEDHFLRLKITQNFAAVQMGEPVDQGYWSSITTVPSYGGSATIGAAILAQQGHVDTVLTALEQQLNQDGGLISNTHDTYALLPGSFEFPESIRRHPRYHALWERPELASLAKARRANGMTAGLPLPVDTTTDGSDEE